MQMFDLIATVLIVGSIAIATLWFFIGRALEVRNSWLAFIPIAGLIVPWRVTNAPRWTLITAIISVATSAVSIVILLYTVAWAIAVGLGSWGVPQRTPSLIQYGAPIAAILLLIALILTMSIITSWTISASHTRGHSTAVGLFASPVILLTAILPATLSSAGLLPLGPDIVFGILTPLILSAAILVRLALLGILAFKKEPF